jgi:hypothetical protein
MRIHFFRWIKAYDATKKKGSWNSSSPHTRARNQGGLDWTCHVKVLKFFAVESRYIIQCSTTISGLRYRWSHGVPSHQEISVHCNVPVQHVPGELWKILPRHNCGMPSMHDLRDSDNTGVIIIRMTHLIVSPPGLWSAWREA